MGQEIRDATHKSGDPAAVMPEDADSYVLVRRFLYTVLTVEECGVSVGNPEVVRATVQAWIGLGRYLREKWERGRLEGICPERMWVERKDGEGCREEFIDEGVRKSVACCVRREVGRFVQEQRRAQESATSERMSISSPRESQDQHGEVESELFEHHRQEDGLKDMMDTEFSKRSNHATGTGSKRIKRSSGLNDLSMEYQSASVGEVRAMSKRVRMSSADRGNSAVSRATCRPAAEADGHVEQDGASIHMLIHELNDQTSSSGLLSDKPKEQIPGVEGSATKRYVTMPSQPALEFTSKKLDAE